MAAAAATVVAAAIWCGSAEADYPVVSATVYPGATGSVATRQVSAATLGGCQPYSGPSTMYMSPSGIDETVPASSWALSTVLTCGLQVPLSNVSQVQIDNPTRGFETPLTNTDLATPSPYQDSSEQPLVSTDGTQDQNTYTRPWLGGADQNAPDQVVENDAPVTIVVYENGSILTVQAQGHVVTSKATGMTVDFTATVKTAQGAVIPASSLSWSWSFGDSATSAAAAPAHTYTSSGDYYVSVQVTDNQNGSGGTDSFEVSSPAAPAPGSTNHHGAGHNHKAKSPSGPTHTSGTHPGAAPGHSRHSGTTTHSHTTTTTGTHAQAPATTSPAPSPPASSPTTTPTQPPPASTRPPAPAHRKPVTRHRTPPARSQPGRLVIGRLVSDVVPLPAADSPLVRSIPAAASAPPVRQATQTTSMTGVAAGIAVALLLALGAARERRGSRAWRTRQH